MTITFKKCCDSATAATSETSRVQNPCRLTRLCSLSRVETWPFYRVPHSIHLRLAQGVKTESLLAVSAQAAGGYGWAPRTHVLYVLDSNVRKALKYIYSLLCFCKRKETGNGTYTIRLWVFPRLTNARFPAKQVSEEVGRQARIYPWRKRSTGSRFNKQTRLFPEAHIIQCCENHPPFFVSFRLLVAVGPTLDPPLATQRQQLC